jgi:hypothetical protein
LPDLAVEAGVLDLGDDDVVGFPEEGDAFGGDFAEDADGEAGAGKGWRSRISSGMWRSRPASLRRGKQPPRSRTLTAHFGTAWS